MAMVMGLGSGHVLLMNFELCSNFPKLLVAAQLIIVGVGGPKMATELLANAGLIFVEVSED
jgi:hypothetical protein